MTVSPTAISTGKFCRVVLRMPVQREVHRRGLPHVLLQIVELWQLGPLWDRLPVVLVVVLGLPLEEQDVGRGVRPALHRPIDTPPPSLLQLSPILQQPNRAGLFVIGM